MRQQRCEFLSISAAQFDDPRTTAEHASNLRRIPLEQPELGACDPVPRQMADGIEETGAERIVQITRRQLSRFQLQIEPDIFPKRRNVTRVDRLRQTLVRE